MKNLSCYIIRASFSQERMTCHRETGQVEYRLKDGKETKMLHALEKSTRVRSSFLTVFWHNVKNEGLTLMLPRLLF